MLISRSVDIIINGDSAITSEPIYLYQNDRNIDIVFTIKDIKYKFNENSGNILVESTAKYATIKVLKPNGEKFRSNKLPIENNTVILTITKDFIDQIEEIGTHIVQIQLYDEEEGRVTIPSINFTVLSPIFEDENEEVTISCTREDE